MNTKNQVPFITLGNGSAMPQLGFGTWTLRDDVAVRSVSEAIRCGYRLIDTAQMYQNEEAVGKGIAAGGVDRSELFITTKITPANMREHRAADSIRESIAALDCGYIDLLLIHWPVAGEVERTWKEMEEFVDEGLVRSLGCSNFHPQHLDDLDRYARIRPVVDQVEVHPYMVQSELVAELQSRGLHVQAWGPYGQGLLNVTKDPLAKEIAGKYGKSAVQTILRWHMQRGLSTIPRSTNPDHMKENISIFDFTLAQEDMDAITALDRGLRSNERNDPDNFPW